MFTFATVYNLVGIRNLVKAAASKKRGLIA